MLEKTFIFVIIGLCKVPSFRSEYNPRDNRIILTLILKSYDERKTSSGSHLCGTTVCIGLLSELFGGVKGMQQTCYKRAQKPILF